MKLFRFREKGGVQPGVAVGDNHYRLREVCPDLAAVDYDGGFFAGDAPGRLRQALAQGEPAAAPLAGELDFAPPVCRPSKIVCLGLNYADHAKEGEAKIPKSPILFAKASTALSGPNDDIVLPAMSQKVDWEVELAFVVGRTARDVGEDWRDFIFGWTLMNDVSARDCQFGDGQWYRGKSFDTFAPTGPYLLTAEEIPDPQTLRLWSKVNGEIQQESTTANMIFPVAHLVQFISRAMTLLPGDLVATGTPEGVGAFQEPPRFLQDGDVVEICVEGVSRQRCRVTGGAATAAAGGGKLDKHAGQRQLGRFAADQKA